jgi:hypothetical protein
MLDYLTGRARTLQNSLERINVFAGASTTSTRTGPLVYLNSTRVVVVSVEDAASRAGNRIAATNHMRKGLASWHSIILKSRDEQQRAEEEAAAAKESY